LRVQVLPSIGEADAVLDAMAAWILEAPAES
jgi:hypothetical protein